MTTQEANQTLHGSELNVPENSEEQTTPSRSPPSSQYSRQTELTTVIHSKQQGGIDKSRFVEY